tara:strand:+ start:1196 stop:5494 length:4299 start_codon:yes stop_codon:yes gene_type:complete
MPNWKKLITSGSSAELSGLKLTGLPAQETENTTLVIDSSGVIGTREVTPGSGTPLSLSVIGSNPNVNSATLTDNTLNLQPASINFGGVVTTGSQSFAGEKTFTTVKGGSFKKDGGLATQYLMADGSVTNTLIGTNTDLNTLTGATVINFLALSDGVITSHGTRTLTLEDLGYTGASNANYITNNNQLTNGEGYITSYTDTNTQRTDAEIDARIALNPEGFIDSYTDTNTQLSTAQVRAKFSAGTNVAISNTGVISSTDTNTDTNTQRTDAEIDARIALNPEGFIDSYTDTNTQLSDAQVRSKFSAGTNVAISSGGVISSTDTNTVYSHPGFNGDDFSLDTGALTGATVISDLDINVTTNSQGHVTDANGTVATRTLTLANLGYTGATNANYITNNNQLSNGSGYQTSTQVNNAIQGVVGAAPAALDTLNELAAAIGDDANFAGTMTTALSGKQAAGNYFTDGDTVLNMTNNDGLVYDDATNKMYVKLDGTNREIFHTGNFAPSSYQSAGTYNTIIGTDSDINTSGATIIDNIYLTDGVMTSHGTRVLTLANLGYTGATNANYITNNNQLSNGANYLTTSGKSADSNLLDGLDLGGTRADVANKVVRTDSNGYTKFGWINTTSGATTSTITDFFVNTNSDGYIRKASKSHVLSQLGIAAGATNVTNNNQLTNGAGYITGTVNRIIGTDSDINTSGAAVLDQLVMTDGVITGHSTRNLTLANLGYTGATNANYITNNNQLSNGAGYLVSSNDRNYITDSRGGQRAPSYYNDRYAQWDFQSSADTTAGGDGWHALLTVSKWSNWNASHRQEQLLFTGNDLKRRTSTSDTTWGTVKTIYDSSNLSLSTLGYIGADNANYITNNNQLTNGRGYVTTSGNTIIGTDTDINTSGATIIDNLYMTDGVITSHGTRALTLGNLGYTGATNANYITNNNQLTNGASYTTCTGDITSVGAGSYLTGGGSSGAVNLAVNATSTSAVSTVVARDSSGDINVRLLRSEYDSTNPTIGFIMTQIDTASNNYVRPSTPAQFRASVTNAHYLGLTSKAADSEKVDGINGASLLRSDADDSFSGGLTSTARNKGIFGTYDSNKTDHIWSMGSAYKNHSSGTNFGNIYGLAYKHTNNTTGGTMGGGHQMVWATNGNPKGAIGETGIWSSTRLTVGGTTNNTGCFSSILGGSYQTVTGGCSTVVGGKYNSTYSCYSVVGGGCANNINHGKFNTVAGGYNNGMTPTGTAEGDTISGGVSNRIVYSSNSCYNTISGGCDNQICSAYHGNNFIGGGKSNCIQSSMGSSNSILGGYSNRVYATSRTAIVGGSNITAYSSNYTYVPNLCNVGGGTSDCRLKESICNIPYGLSHVSQLEPVSYKFKSDESKATKYGFLAQCVQEIMPDLITNHPTDLVDGTPILQFDKDAIWSSMVNAIKDLKNEVDVLKARIDVLEA